MKKLTQKQITKNICDKLLKFRIDNDLTQREMGDKMDVRFQQYQKYENGTNRLSLDRAMMFCRAVNKSLSFFDAGDK